MASSTLPVAGLTALYALEEGATEVEAPWTEVGEVAARLIHRGYAGKAVLRVGPN